jgi:uncharacterized protein YkwD
MAKQKPVTKTRVHAKSVEHKQTLRALHRRRAWWFTVLTSGLVLIQFAYNLHSDGQPRVLGYATSMNAAALLKDTNDYRSRSNLSTLHENDALDRAAQAKADNMIAQDYWSHVSPDGTTPWYYFQKVGYNYSVAGENLAYGFATSDQVVTAWMNSQEHRDNVLGNYQDVGFGFANGNNYQHGKNTVVVAMYGLPSDQSPAGVVTHNAAPTATTNASSIEQHVNGATSIVNGNAPWATYASIALLGATILGFLVTHMETLKLGWHNARKYAIVHPAVDAAVLVVLALVVVQAAGGFIR